MVTKKAFRYGALILVVMTILTLFAAALEMPYEGYTYNFWGESVRAPAGYMPSGVWEQSELGLSSLTAGEDIFVYGDTLFILDGGGQILKFDKNLNRIGVLNDFTLDGESYTLKNPQGIFVGENRIYIADTGNAKSVAMDWNGNITQTFERPQVEAIANIVEFKPSQIVVDTADNVYVICTNIYQGFLNYEADGTFKGFFGSNRVQMSVDMFATLIWKRIFSHGVAKNLERFLPVEFSNAYVDGDFVYTVTRANDNSVNEVQKLNASGQNILKFPSNGTRYPKNNFGDVETIYVNYALVDSQLVDIHVDDLGIISILDRERGRVFQYDQDCNLICIFGGQGSQIGCLEMPAAIEKLGDDYLVLDKKNGRLTRFSATTYMKYVRQGIFYFHEGLYDKAMEPWREVLRLNSNFALAYQSIGKAYLQKNEYKTAMEYFKRGQDRLSYSTALRAYRAEFMRENFVLLLVIAIVAIVVFVKLLRWIQFKLGISKPKRKITIS